jgi:hypothetical protein
MEWGEEAHFVEEICTQGLCPCTLMAVGVVNCRGPFQGDCKGRGGIGLL